LAVLLALLIDAVVYGRGLNTGYALLKEDTSIAFTRCNFIIPEELQNDPSIVRKTVSQCDKKANSPFSFQKSNAKC
jgi:hypothetical protein